MGRKLACAESALGYCRENTLGAGYRGLAPFFVEARRYKPTRLGMGSLCLYTSIGLFHYTIPLQLQREKRAIPEAQFRRDFAGKGSLR
jgi:hypothetical protein